MPSAYGVGSGEALLREQLRLSVDGNVAGQEAQLAIRRKLGVGIPLYCKELNG